MIRAPVHDQLSNRYGFPDIAWRWFALVERVVHVNVRIVYLSEGALDPSVLQVFESIRMRGGRASLTEVLEDCAGSHALDRRIVSEVLFILVRSGHLRLVSDEREPQFVLGDASSASGRRLEELRSTVAFQYLHGAGRLSPSLPEVLNRDPRPALTAAGLPHLLLPLPFAPSGREFERTIARACRAYYGHKPVRRRLQKVQRNEDLQRSGLLRVNSRFLGCARVSLKTDSPELWALSRCYVAEFPSGRDRQIQVCTWSRGRSLTHYSGYVSTLVEKDRRFRDEVSATAMPISLVIDRPDRQGTLPSL